jgi:hypothetical protein
MLGIAGRRLYVGESVLGFDHQELGEVAKVVLAARICQKLIAALTEQLLQSAIERGVQRTRERGRVGDIEHFGSPESKKPPAVRPRAAVSKNAVRVI